MSSKLRIIVAGAGGYYSGSDAKAILSQSGSMVRSLAQMQIAAKAIGLQLWICREPRETTASRSRYIKLCRRLGIRRPKKAKRAYAAANPAPPAPINYNEILGYNAVQGYAPAAAPQAVAQGGGAWAGLEPHFVWGQQL